MAFQCCFVQPFELALCSVLIAVVHNSSGLPNTESPIAPVHPHVSEKVDVLLRKLQPSNPCHPSHVAGPAETTSESRTLGVVQRSPSTGTWSNDEFSRPLSGVCYSFQK
jgi:hypothetical protein